MNVSLNKACVTVVVALIVGVGLGYALGHHKTAGVTGIDSMTHALSGPFSSPYSVDCEIFPNGYSDQHFGGWSCACLIATVKGPAAKLAVILTDSQGRTRVEVIEKERMIANSERVLLGIPDSHSKPQGTYILAVKTFDPEKVVWQKEITFSPAIERTSGRQDATR